MCRVQGVVCRGVGCRGFGGSGTPEARPLREVHKTKVLPCHRQQRPAPPIPCRVQGSGCRVQGAGFRVQGAGRRVQGSAAKRGGNELNGLKISR